MPVDRLLVKERKDGKRYVETTEFSSSSLNDLGLKLYILSSDDSHYYQLDIDATGSGTIAVTDVGTTAPTDGLVFVGG